MSELRVRRTVAVADEKVAPLDTAEQERIIRDFQIDKMKQDALWKHAMAVVYGFTALLLLLVLACSVLFGCAASSGGAATVDSPLSGPSQRCVYFALPGSLWSATRSAVATNALLAGALLLVVLWGVYSFMLDATGTKVAFNDSRAAAAATAAAHTQVQSSARAAGEQTQVRTDSGLLPTTAAAVPIALSEWARLQWVQRVAHAGVAAWACASAALVCLHVDPDGLGLLVWLLLVAPLVLVSLTKLAARWSRDLEEQIRDLQKCKYSYHEL